MKKKFCSNSGQTRLPTPEGVANGGQVLVLVLIFLIVILVTTLSIFSLVSFFTRNSSQGYFSEQALHLAEAGVDKAVQSLNEQGSSYTGESNTSLGDGVFTVTISDVSFGVKEITSTGYIPNYASPQSKKKVKVRVTTGTANISFRYAVQVGTGGLDMSNSATVHGNIYSNGNITGSGSSKIDGDAYAVGTISSPDPTVTGTKKINQPPSEMPTVDYNFWKDAADGQNNDLITTCTPTCTISSDTTIGPRKYLGNLEITNNAIVTMNGPIYVTGNFAIKQGRTTLKLNQSFGSSGTVLIADGTIDLTQGGTFLPTSAAPKGYILVVTTSTSSQAVQISQTGATAVFYVLEGGAQLSQTANVSSLVAKTLSMSQTSELSYEFGLASASFTSGPGGSWQILSGSYKID